VPGSPGFDRQVTRLAGVYKAGNGAGIPGGAFGGASLGAIHQAEAAIYRQMHSQAGTLAYVDIIRYLTLFCACMLPLLLFIPKPPKNMRAGH
jgi:DHA2 family multidrug resistance protein